MRVRREGVGETARREGGTVSSEGREGESRMRKKGREGVSRMRK